MNTEKKRLLIFIAIAYGVTYLWGLLMWYGHAKGYDLSAFPNAQMLYPAAGVALGLLIVNKGQKNIPKGFMITLIATAAAAAVLSVVSVIVPVAPIELAAADGSVTSVSVYNTIASYIIVLGSIVGIVFFFVGRKQKRENAGLNWKNTKMSLLMILLFIGLYLLRIVLNLLISGIVLSDVGLVFTSWFAVLANPLVWITALMLPISFVSAYSAFLGEEYGWRYYFQPYLQERFGLKTGIFVLGVVWGLWHLPIDLFYYTQTTPVQMAVAQIVTCISISIFFGYAYLKTENIWVPVIMHFLNNNLVPILSGELSSSVLENQSVSWLDIPISLAINGVVFWLFIFSPVFKKKEDKTAV